MLTLKVGERGQVVIPEEILKKLSLKEGDVIEVIKVDPDDILTPEEEALVLEGEKQLRCGEYLTLEELEHDLDRQDRKTSPKTAGKVSS